MDAIFKIFGKTSVAGGGTLGAIVLAILAALNKIPGVDPNVQFVGCMLFGLLAVVFVLIASYRNPDGSSARDPYNPK